MLKKRIKQIISKGSDDLSQPVDPTIQRCKEKLTKLFIKIQKQQSKQKHNLKQAYPINIWQNIFIGNYTYASQQEFLQDNNIGLMISCMAISPAKQYPNIRYQKISIKDNQQENILKYANQIYQIIQQFNQRLLSENKKQSIYIHCFEGKSRSASIFLLYALRKSEKTLQQLMNLLSERSSKFKPNSNFLAQLEQYQIRIKNGQFKNKVQDKEQSQKNKTNTQQAQEDLINLNQTQQNRNNQKNIISIQDMNTNKKEKQDLLQQCRQTQTNIKIQNKQSQDLLEFMQSEQQQVKVNDQTQQETDLIQISVNDSNSRKQSAQLDIDYEKMQANFKQDKMDDQQKTQNKKKSKKKKNKKR